MANNILVRFIYVTSAELKSLPYQEGQIIALTDASGYYYDMGGERRTVSNNVNLSSVPFAITTEKGSSTTLFMCVVPEIEQLNPGTCMYVINSRPSATAAFSLDVNNLGVKPVYYTNGARATRFDQNDGAFFIYNTQRQPGGCWDMINEKSYSLYQFGQTAVTCSTASKISAKVAGDVVTSRGYELTSGAVVSVQFTNAVIGDATLNIYGTGAKAIVYHGYPLQGNEIGDGATAYFMYVNNTYMLLGVDTIISDVRELQKLAGTPGLYWATYDVTPFNDLVTASNEGKLCVMNKGGIIYIMSVQRGKMVFSPLARNVNCEQNICTVSGWETSELILATKSEVDEKYTFPEGGIPVNDLNFHPAIVDKTFTQDNYAAESLITGQRIAQVEEMERLSDFTETNIVTWKWGKFDVEPTTGLKLQDSPYWYQAALLTNIPFNTDLLFTLNDDKYSWASWASQNQYCGYGMTHPAMIGGWVSGNIPLLLQYKSGDYYAALTIRRKDGTIIDDAEFTYLSNQITVLSKPNLSSITHVPCLTKNNSMLADQLLAIAETYYSASTDVRPDGTLRLTYGSPTILDTNQDTNKIDSATFVGLVLRGLPYGETPYATGDYVNPDTIVNNDSYTWAFNPAYYANKKFTGSRRPVPLRTASQLAQQYYEWGRIVPQDDKLINLERGDLIFYAQKTASGEWAELNTFMHISHVAICNSKVIGSSVPEWDSTTFPYYHTMLHVSSDSGDEESNQPYCVFKSVVEQDADSANPDYTGINYHTIQLIVRPDLGTLTQLIDKSTKVLPSNPLRTGEPGQMMFDENTLYICVSTNKWKKVSLTSI